MIYENVKNEHLDKMLKFKNHLLREWIGWNYKDYLTNIIEWIKSHGFEDVDGLTKSQIMQMRTDLINAFKKGSNIRDISRRLLNAGLKDLELNVPTKYDGEGNVIRQGYSRMIPKEYRAEIVARTETIRASAEGELNQLREEKITNKVRFSAAISDRTCEICMALNGKVFTLEDASGQIPVHCACRCSFLPMV